MARHQQVYAALGDRMREQIHALSMKTLTPAEYGQVDDVRLGTASPALHHGSRTVRAAAQAVRRSADRGRDAQEPCHAESTAVLQERHGRVTRPWIPPTGFISGPNGQTPDPRRRAALRGEVGDLRRQERGAAELCAALLTRRRSRRADNVPQLQDVATTLKLLRSMGVAAERDGAARQVRSTPATIDLARGAVRAGEDDARVDPGAGPAAGALRRRRRCRCPAAARSARARSTSTSRACRRWARDIDVEHGYIVAEAARLQGRAHHHRHGDRHRHREPDDGRDAGRGRDGARERRAGARGRRPGRAADRDGRADRRRTARAASASRASSGCTARAHRVMPDRIETGTFLCAVAAAGGDVLLRGAAPSTSTR